MTTQKLLKRRVRERMSKTGERYTAARRHVVAKRNEPSKPAWDLAAANEIVSDERLAEQTGHGWEGWLTLLDGWGARDKKRREIVDFLIAQHGVPGWFAQAVTNGFERASGIRVKHQQPTGFTVYASKTIAVSLDTLFDAFVVKRRREEWLVDGQMTLRTSAERRTARFDWNGGPTRLLLTFEAKQADKSTAYVAHERLPSASEAEKEKRSWKYRLSDLKSFLESDRS